MGQGFVRNSEQIITACLTGGLMLLGMLGGMDLSRAAEAPSELRITAPTPITPIRITNESGSSSISRLQLQQRWDMREMDLLVSGGCTSQKAETNIHERGVFVAEMLAGYGSDRDSFWTKQVYEGADRSTAQFKERITVKLDTALLRGSAFDMDAPKSLQQLAARHPVGSKAALEFYRKNQKFQLKLPLRLEVICQQYEHDKIRQKTQLLKRWSRVLTKEISIPVLYAGDPKLKQSSLKPLILKNATGAGQGIQKSLRLHAVQIITGPKNLRGNCPISAAFKVRLSGEGRGVIRLIAKTNTGGKITSEEVKFSGPEQEIGFSLLIDDTSGAEPYAQQLGKLFVEVQGRSEIPAASNLYSSRRKADPYLWQFSCIEQSD
jgi:hypothetical protein